SFAARPDGDAVGAVPGDEFLQAGGDARQARGHRVARRNFDGAADHARQTIVREQVDDAVTGVFGAAVDAEDAHGGSVAGQLPVVSGQLPVSRSQLHLGLRDLVALSSYWKSARAPRSSQSSMII